MKSVFGIQNAQRLCGMQNQTLRDMIIC